MNFIDNLMAAITARIWQGVCVILSAFAMKDHSYLEVGVLILSTVLFEIYYHRAIERIKNNAD